MLPSLLAAGIIPSVLHREGQREYHTDLYSRLLKERIILLTGPVTDQSAEGVIAQMLYLDYESKAVNAKTPIQLFINSPGGSVSAGLAIHDTMKMVQSPVATYCLGQAASMGAFLLASGTKGMRHALPHASIMIHQPLIGGGGLSGQATEIVVHAKQIEYTRKLLDGLLAQYTGQTVKRIHADTERDKFLTAEEALKYGLIDQVLPPTHP